MAELERFWSKVNKTENCWEWTGIVNKDGYGRFWYGGKFVFAHRLSYEFAKGKPSEMLVLHKCDNPCCVNPEHLFLGTPAENIADAKTKNRLAIGSRHSIAKLTEQDVTAIRAHYINSGATSQELANKYGVSRRAIWGLLARRTWKHVP